jgi:chromate reductase, NAD(P)H dehydrogenase (quinone)
MTRANQPESTLHRDPVKAVGLVGSLRRGSFNRRLLESACLLAPDDLEIEVFDGIGDIPLFNEDVAEGGDPPAVAALRQAITAADALVIATPEYNYGVPGVLKNALDWVSIPAGHSGMEGRTVAMMGASPSILGTARAQTQLRQLFVFTQSHVVPFPEVFVTKAHTRFDEKGRLTDPGATKLIGRLFENLVDLTRRLQREEPHP